MRKSIVEPIEFTEYERFSLLARIAENIRALMALKGWRQIDLSRASGVSPQGVRFYIGRNDDFVDMGVWNLYRIATALDVSVDFLMTGSIIVAAKTANENKKTEANKAKTLSEE